MADKNIHEGDEVQWNWGSSHPTGHVSSIATSGQLEITTKGKKIHKNASPENPAVHVARSKEKGEGNGNDVVKRMSELEKVGGGEEEEEEEGKEDETDEKNEEGEEEEEEPGKESVGQKRRRSTEKEEKARGNADVEDDEDVDVEDADSSDQATKAEKSTDGADASDEPPTKKMKAIPKKSKDASSNANTVRKTPRTKLTAPRGGAAGGKKSVGRPRKGSQVDSEVQTEKGDIEAKESEAVKAKN